MAGLTNNFHVLYTGCQSTVHITPHTLHIIHFLPGMGTKLRISFQRQSVMDEIHRELRNFRHFFHQFLQYASVVCGVHVHAMSTVLNVDVICSKIHYDADADHCE